MATTLDDVLSRRTRARLLDRAAAVAAAPAVAALLAGELGWDDDEVGAPGRRLPRRGRRRGGAPRRTPAADLLGSRALTR